MRIRYVFTMCCLVLAILVFPSASYCLSHGTDAEAFAYIMEEDGSGRKLHPIQEKQKIYNEAWLQNLLRTRPDILPIADIDPVYWPMIPIGYEVSTDTGRIDNLFISHSGHVILVETKLWQNPEAKRKVVAQAIDYASSLSGWTYNELNIAAKKYLKKYETTESDLADWVEKQLGPPAGGKPAFIAKVTENLQAGRFLTVIVSDKIRAPVFKMADYLNNYPNLGIKFALIELKGYWTETDANWPLLIVPRIAINRPCPSTPPPPPPPPIGFWTALKRNAPDSYDKVRNLVDEYRKKDGIEIVVKQTLHVRFTIPQNGRKVSVFYVDKKARLGVWPKDIAGDMILQTKLASEIIRNYDEKMKKILNMPEKRIKLSRHIDEVDIHEFKSAVDEFMKRIQNAD
ncbi:hypothetical protein [Desulfonema magnum]|uniref:Uncharacterized protein n=1 Tax=Desulfonema magnum TaxID=45655 RepID=A0A975GP39_9BACT|nr:hypothetical protein [Desulfonema magnum]QTA87508.1 Uncharacterized protein dnm_035420 [Desulfonema magnum]